MIFTMTPEEVRALIEPPKPQDRRSRQQGCENLTENQAWIIGHWSMFGSEGYPVRKLGRGWQVTGQRGHGSFPTVFKRKKDAVKAWEGYIDLLFEYKQGTVRNPALRD